MQTKNTHTQTRMQTNTLNLRLVRITFISFKLEPQHKKTIMPYIMHTHTLTHLHKHLTNTNTLSSLSLSLSLLLSMLHVAPQIRIQKL